MPDTLLGSGGQDDSDTRCSRQSLGRSMGVWATSKVSGGALITALPLGMGFATRSAVSPSFLISREVLLGRLASPIGDLQARTELRRRVCGGNCRCSRLFSPCERARSDLAPKLDAVSARLIHVMNGPVVELVAVDDAATRSAARSLIGEYLRWIASSASASYGLSFDVDAMVASDLDDRAKFYPPSGRFYVVRHGGSYVGVGCLKRLTPTVAEIQRMYVQTELRGAGAGRRLVQQLLADARAIGYEIVRLESLKFLAAAHALYKSVGFVEITPYAENSMKQFQPAETINTYRSSAVFMETRL